MLDRRWNQQRMRMEVANTVSTALIIPGAPSVVTVVGGRRLRPIMLRKNSVHAASASLLPTARCSRCFRPSLSMHQATSRASLAPWRRSDSKMASQKRYSTAMSSRSRAMKAW
jgi:hypothetical protein